MFGLSSFSELRQLWYDKKQQAVQEAIRWHHRFPG
jgi:hypothetical protein